jgi:hypothetical protein
MSLNKSLSNQALGVYFGIAIFVALVYGNTLSFSYAGDDTALISQNKVVQNGFSSLSDLLTKSAQSLGQSIIIHTKWLSTLSLAMLTVSRSIPYFFIDYTFISCASCAYRSSCQY